DAHAWHRTQRVCDRGDHLRATTLADIRHAFDDGHGAASTTALFGFQLSASATRSQPWGVWREPGGERRKPRKPKADPSTSSGSSRAQSSDEGRKPSYNCRGFHMVDSLSSRRRPPEGTEGAEHDARIEHLLITGLDHYFAGEFETAINLW